MATVAVAEQDGVGAALAAVEAAAENADSPRAGSGRKHEHLLNAYPQLEDDVLELSFALQQGPHDYEARRLFERLVQLRRAIHSDVKEDDRRNEVDIALLDFRDVLGRLKRRITREGLDDPKTAVRFVRDSLPGARAKDLANLFGVSVRTWAAYIAEAPVEKDPNRATLLAQLVAELRATLTPRGVLMWFEAPREQLGGRNPLALLNEGQGAGMPELLALARGARGQLGG